MNPQPHDGPAEGGLACSTLRLAHHPRPVVDLRQMLSSFNHRCRNSLNGIKMGLYLFKREFDGPTPGSWLELEQMYQEMEVLFDRLQLIYRPLSLTVVRSPLGRLIEERLPTWRSWLGRQGRTLELTRPPVDLPGDFDPMHLGMGLDAFIGSRAEAGRPLWKTRLSWGIADGSFEVQWEESLPANGSRVHKHENGRTEGSRPEDKSDSLAHPLLKRIVAAHGGFVETAVDPAFVVKLRWPRFQPSERAK